jgi:hypothetical protein
MKKNTLRTVRGNLSLAAICCTKLKEFICGITDTSQRQEAERTWHRLNRSIRIAREEMKAWKIGYPKGQHRIKDDQLEAIRQWYAAPHPKPKVRALAKTLGISPTTVYAVLKELGWKKAAKG